MINQFGNNFRALIICDSSKTVFFVRALFILFVTTVNTGCSETKPQSELKFDPKPRQAVELKWVSKYGRRTPYARIGTPAELREAREKIRTLALQAKERRKQQGIHVISEDSTIEIPFFPADPQETSLGQRILIIESVKNRLNPAFPFCTQFQSAFTFYRKRVLGAYYFQRLRHFKAKRIGTYESPKIQIGYSPENKEAIEYIESLPFIVPSQILSLSSDLLAWEVGIPGLTISIFGEESKCAESDHGDPIFRILADFNPEAQFVLANTPAISDFESALRGGDPTITIEDYRDYMNRWVKETLRLISKYEISFVNMSWGVPKDEDGDWPLREQFYRIFLDSLEKLAKESAIPIIQAAPNVHDDLDLLNAHVHPGVQQELQQRVPGLFKIGAYSKRELGAPLEGTNKASHLQKGMRAIWNSVDIYVNNGSYGSDYPIPPLKHRLTQEDLDRQTKEDYARQDEEHYWYNEQVYSLFDRYIDEKLAVNAFPKIDQFMGLVYQESYSSVPLLVPFSYQIGYFHSQQDVYRSGNSFGAPMAISFINALYQEGYWQSVEELERLLKPEGQPRLYSPLYNGFLELYLAMDQFQRDSTVPPTKEQ